MRIPHTAVKSSPSLLQLEKAHTQQQRPNTAKIYIYIYIYIYIHMYIYIYVCVCIYIYKFIKKRSGGRKSTLLAEVWTVHLVLHVALKERCYQHIVAIWFNGRTWGNYWQGNLVENYKIMGLDLLESAQGEKIFSFHVSLHKEFTKLLKISGQDNLSFTCQIVVFLDTPVLAQWSHA